jgi:PAS domain S-box-containing protein
MTAQSTPDEARRIKHLREYGVLDTPPEQGLDELTALAAQICETPIALISLVDENRQWFKATFGLEMVESPRNTSFCSYALDQRELFIVPDAAQDERFAQTPLVTGEPHIRFYAGAPLVGPEDTALGTLCVIDRVPRTLTELQKQALQVLARQVMAHLELRRQTRELVVSEERLQLVTDNARVGLVIVNQDRRYIYANNAYAEILGLPSSAIVGERVQDVLPEIYEEQIGPRLARAFSGQRVTYELCKPAADGDCYYEVRYEPRKADGAVALVVVVITDITERKKSELVSLRMAAIVEFSDDAIIGKDLNSIIGTWNRGAEKIFGYSASEMVGSSIMRLIPNDRRDEENQILGKIRCGESVEHFETLRQTKDGRLIDVSVTASPIKDANGKPIGVSKVARDITESKRADEVRRISEARYHVLFEHAPDGIVITNPQGYYLDTNLSMCRMIGYSRDEFIGLHISDIVVPSEIAHIDPSLKSVNATADHYREWKFRRKDGRVFAADVTATVMPDGKLMGMVRDVTERKRVEGALQEREEQLRLYAAYSPAAIAMLDRDMKYLVVSRRWMEVYRLEEESIIGRSHYELFPEISERWKKIHQRCLGGAVEKCDEEAFLRADGNTNWIRWEVRPWRGADGSIGGIIIFSEDISERKAASEQIHQLNVELEQRVIERTQQLETANKELEAFSYSVSHDLRAPLRAVNGFSKIVLDNFGSQIPADARELLELICKGGEQMGELIDDLLAFSKFSRQLMSRQAVDSVRLVQTVLDNSVSQRQDRPIEIHVGDLPPCQGDAALLKQVWVNLISNAIKYTRGREPGVIEIGCQRTNNENVYFVRDNGAGFDMQNASKLFGVFQRFHGADEFEGTGVGLAIVQRIVNRHGGRIWAAAEVGRGATFSFTLEPENQS